MLFYLFKRSLFLNYYLVTKHFYFYLDALNEASKLKFEDEKDDSEYEINEENVVNEQQPCDAEIVSANELNSSIVANKILNSEKGDEINMSKNINKADSLVQKSDNNQTTSATLHEKIPLHQTTSAEAPDKVPDTISKTELETSKSPVSLSKSPVNYTLIAENVKLKEEKEDFAAENATELHLHDQKVSFTGDQKPVNPVNLNTTKNYDAEKMLNSSANSVISKTASFLVDETGSQSLLSSSTTSESESESDHKQVSKVSFASCF